MKYLFRLLGSGRFLSLNFGIVGMGWGMIRNIMQVLIGDIAKEMPDKKYREKFGLLAKIHKFA